MKTSGQFRYLITAAGSRLATVALAFIVVLAATVASPSAQAQTFTLLHSFQGPPLDGWAPESRLIFDGSGNLYGTTLQGGSGPFAQGVVFELDTLGNETILHNFSAPAGDGAGPRGDILRYAGNLYGSTAGSGTGCGCGAIFEISRGKETIVQNFTGDAGKYPMAGLTRDAAGKLYGTTHWGSIGTPPPSCGSVGCGVVFEISNGQETALYSFGGVPDGNYPLGGLIVDGSGNLYGTTELGGTFNQGAVFELSPNSDGTWTEQVLYNFRGKSDGGGPQSDLVMDLKGNIYGSTPTGGLNSPACQTGCGVVFRLRPNHDGTWTETVLHRFDGNDGKYPGDLIRDNHGNLYGVTNGGGASGYGLVFEMNTAGAEKVLHTFTGAPADGAYPFSGVTMDTSGNLYGTTSDGGGSANCAGGCGTVFKITP